MINSFSSSEEPSPEWESLTVISGRFVLLAMALGLPGSEDDTAALSRRGDGGRSGVVAEVAARRLDPPQELLLVWVSADPVPPSSPLLLIVVVVVVVATMVARESKFMVILKCFFCTCVRMSCTREKARSHTGHLVLPECMSRCRVSDMGCRKPFQHTLHLN